VALGFVHGVGASLLIQALPNASMRSVLIAREGSDLAPRGAGANQASGVRFPL